MSDDDIEIGGDVDVAVVLDSEGHPIATVVDELVVATGPAGSMVEETIDVFDDSGRVILADEVVHVYDEDGRLVTEIEQITEAG